MIIKLLCCCNMTNLRICQIVPYIHNEASGPSYSVPSLTLAIKKLNYEIVLLTLDKRKLVPDWSIEIIKHQPNLFLNKVGWSIEANKWFKENAKKYDIFHTNGLWMFPNVTPLKIANKIGKKCVLSPRGTTNKEALKYSRIKKFLFYTFFQKDILRKVDMLHVTSDDELNDVRKLGLKQPVAIIPNGIDIPEIRYKKDRKVFKLIYLGRIHPKKGLENTIQAWSSVENLFPNWIFEIAGLGEKKYEEKIKKLILDTQSKSISFIGPVYGEDKIKFIQTSDILIMPSYNENFGMVVAEALSNSVPVICGENTPWQKIIPIKCGWHIPNDTINIKKTFLKVFKMSKNSLNIKGMNGRLWVEKDYSWKQVAKKMLLSYEWLISKKNKPKWINI